MLTQPQQTPIQWFALPQLQTQLNNLRQDRLMRSTQFIGARHTQQMLHRTPSVLEQNVDLFQRQHQCVPALRVVRLQPLQNLTTACHNCSHSRSNVFRTNLSKRRQSLHGQQGICRSLTLTSHCVS